MSADHLPECLPQVREALGNPTWYGDAEVCVVCDVIHEVEKRVRAEIDAAIGALPGFDTYSWGLDQEGPGEGAYVHRDAVGDVTTPGWRERSTS